jgi:hypothetical protein
MGHERGKLLNGLDPNAFRPAAWHFPIDKTPQCPDDIEVAPRGNFQPKIRELRGFRFFGVDDDHFTIKTPLGQEFSARRE